MYDDVKFRSTILTIIGTMLLVKTGDPKIVAGVFLIIIGHIGSYHQ